MTSSYRSVFWTMVKDSTAPPSPDAEALTAAVPEAPPAEGPAPSTSDSGNDCIMEHPGPAAPGGSPVPSSSSAEDGDASHRH